MSRLPIPKLNPRDRRAVLVGGILVLALAIVFGWVLPRFDRIQSLDRAIAAERQRLQEVRRLHGAVLELNEREAKAQELLGRRSAEAFSVASVIETMAQETKVMEQVQYLKPEQAKVSEQFREASVSLKMTEISLNQLVDFLYRVESSDRILRVRNLQIRNNQKEVGKLDVTLTVFTLVPATAAVRSQEPESVPSPPGAGETAGAPSDSGQPVPEEEKPAATPGQPDSSGEKPPRPAPPPSS